MYDILRLRITEPVAHQDDVRGGLDEAVLARDEVVGEEMCDCRLMGLDHNSSDILSFSFIPALSVAFRYAS